MQFSVVNHELSVGYIRVIGVASSSLFLIGDAEVISLGSVFDTPPESYIVGPLTAFAQR